MSDHSSEGGLKEERRRILKICVNKLQTIQDPETYLCRSVLINNTFKHIQKSSMSRHSSKHKNRLKRQKERILHEDDPPEPKKSCIRQFDQVEREEIKSSDDVLELNDVKNPLCSSYYDVETYTNDIIEEVLFNEDNTVDLDHAAPDPHHDDEGSGLTRVNVSITSLNSNIAHDIAGDEEDHDHDIAVEEDDQTLFSNNNNNVNVGDNSESCRSVNSQENNKFTESLLHTNSSISLESC